MAKGLETTVPVETLNILSAIAVIALQDVAVYDEVKAELSAHNITEPMLDNSIEYARKYCTGA